MSRRQFRFYRIYNDFISGDHFIWRHDLKGNVVLIYRDTCGHTARKVLRDIIRLDAVR